jgi:excisionase family DNA binding protein
MTTALTVHQPTPEDQADDGLGDVILTEVELAALLKTSRRTLQRMRSAGELPGADLRVGTSPRWKRSTIRKWLKID